MWYEVMSEEAIDLAEFVRYSHVDSLAERSCVDHGLTDITRVRFRGPWAGTDPFNGYEAWCRACERVVGVIVTLTNRGR